MDPTSLPPYTVHPPFCCCGLHILLHSSLVSLPFPRLSFRDLLYNPLKVSATNHQLKPPFPSAFLSTFPNCSQVPSTFLHSALVLMRSSSSSSAYSSAALPSRPVLPASIPWCCFGTHHSHSSINQLIPTLSVSLITLTRFE